MSDETALAKVFIVIFVFEVIGILLALGGLGQQVNTSGITSTTRSINGSVMVIHNVLNSTLIAPAQASYQTSNCGLTCNVGSFVSIFVNGFIWLVNFIYKVAVIILTLIVMLGELVLLIFNSLFIFLSLFTQTGILGYILGLGFIFIFGFVLYKFGRTILALVGVAVGVIRTLIP